MDISNLPARTRVFADGEVLLQAGSDHEIGFVILSGRVRLYDQLDVPVETLTDGDVAGAVSLLFGGAQTLTAVASGPVEAATIDRSIVSAAFARSPDMVREAATRLLAQLDLMPLDEGARAPESTEEAPEEIYERSDRGKHDGPLAAPGVWREVRVKPLTPETRNTMPRRGIVVREFPFGIGRKPLRHEQTPRTEMSLMLIDNKPYNLSRSHFVIEHGPDALMVRDVGSHLGTEVNGERIGVDNILNARVLRMGENEVAAGRHDTPFRFLIEILP